MRSGPGETLGHRVHVNPERERAAVTVAELRRDIGRGHAGCGQEARRGVPERVDVDARRQAGPADQLPERLGGVVGPDRRTVDLGDDQVLVDTVGVAEDQAALELLGAVTAQLRRGSGGALTL